jgi:hypothetical protein
MTELERFLSESPIAEGVELPSALILGKERLSPAEAESIEGSGTYSAPASREVELEAGGRIIAAGKVVKRRGAYYLKVTKTGGI